MDELTDLDKAAILASAEEVVNEMADGIASDAINHYYDGLTRVIDSIEDRHCERAQLLRRALFHMDLAREGLS